MFAYDAFIFDLLGACKTCLELKPLFGRYEIVFHQIIFSYTERIILMESLFHYVQCRQKTSNRHTLCNRKNGTKQPQIFFKNCQVLSTCTGRFHKHCCKLWGDSVEKVILYDFLRFIFNVLGENLYIPNYESQRSQQKSI